MPPKTANKRKAAAAVEVDPSEDGDAANDVQDSQQVADKDMTDKLNATMIALHTKQKKRRADSRKQLQNITNQYQQKVEDLQKQRETEILKLRQKYLSQLYERIRRKKEIEAKMFESLETLGKECLVMNEALAGTLQKRVEELGG